MPLLGLLTTPHYGRDYLIQLPLSRLLYACIQVAKEHGAPAFPKAEPCGAVPGNTYISISGFFGLAEKKQE
jgi:hypothetical protein